jgi:hypothetical protein
VSAPDYRHRYPAEILRPGARAPSFDLPVTPDRQLAFFVNGPRHNAGYDLESLLNAVVLARAPV